MSTHSVFPRNSALSEPEGLLHRATTRVRRFMCGLSGHDSMLHFEQGRMSLLCSTCGHKTPGWEVGTEGPQPRRTQTPERLRVVRMPFADHRRVA